MDWDSPTTKKHIEEARAQGCELLGPGKSKNYRTYRLPCGHEQELQVAQLRVGRYRCKKCFQIEIEEEAISQGCRLVGIGKNTGREQYRVYQLPCGHHQEIPITRMRSGSFRCQTCLEQRFNGEAERRGCKVVGSGRNANYRTYRLPCGHEQEVQVIRMRSGGFRCQTCLEQKLNDEAQAQGCELIGEGKTKRFRNYRLPCDHEQEVITSSMRSGGFRCQTCLEQRFHYEATQAGLKLIGPGKSSSYRIYVLPCGHEQEVQLSNVRNSAVRCEICLKQKLQNEAEEQGCVLIGAGRSDRYRTYLLPCGHEQELQMGNVRRGQFHCQTCFERKLKDEAIERDCELIGKGRNYNCRIYRLPCGHEQEMQPIHVRAGTFRCRTCDDYHFTQPSNIYLLHIKCGPDQWLKLGIAKEVRTRIEQYGLPPDAKVREVLKMPVETGLEALQLEKYVHTEYADQKLPAEEMQAFHQKSGATECYPVTMIDTLLAEFK